MEKSLDIKEIIREIEEEEDVEKKKLDLEVNFKIDEEKTKELISTFKQSKLNIQFNNHSPDFLRNGKSYVISDGIIKIYDEIMNNIYQINIEQNYTIHSGIELNNNDLIFLSSYIFPDNETDNNTEDDNIFIILPYEKKNSLTELLVYRLKDKKYYLSQKIYESSEGYELQYSCSGCLCEDVKEYRVDFLKGISGNRFICINNYGFKIYSLNEQKEYSSILLVEHLEGIKEIFEINDNNFIFCTNKHYDVSLGEFLGHNKIIIEKIKLNEISKNEKEKLSYICETIFEYSRYEKTNYISDSLILKNKYFITLFNTYMLIFNLKSGKEVKRLQIWEYLHLDKVDIKPWDSVDQNEFLLFYDGKVILFKLKEDENENLELIIISQLDFPNIKDIKLKKIPDKKNKFYSVEREFANLHKRKYYLNLY